MPTEECDPSRREVDQADTSEAAEFDLQKHAEFLETELEYERKTNDELLAQMEMIELEARSKAEESKKREGELEHECRMAQRLLEDERALRLQNDYMLARAQADADTATAEAKKMNAVVLDLQEEIRIQQAESDALRAALVTAKRLAEQTEDDLRAQAASNVTAESDAQLLRRRLLEAEDDATQWREKYEEALEAAKRDRTAFGKMVSETRTKARDHQTPTMGYVPGRGFRAPELPGGRSRNRTELPLIGSNPR